MIDNKNNEVLRLDIRLKGKDREKFLENMQMLEYKKYSTFIRDFSNCEFLYVNLYRKMVNEFRKQGNNLNQIAKIMNEDKRVSDENLERLKNIENLYREMLKEIKNYEV